MLYVRGSVEDGSYILSLGRLGELKALYEAGLKIVGSEHPVVQCETCMSLESTNYLSYFVKHYLEPHATPCY
jgi:hypothetical protein